jgi:hypothetical protein
VPQKATKLGWFVIGDFAELRGFWDFVNFVSIYGLHGSARFEVKMRMPIQSGSWQMAV